MVWCSVDFLLTVEWIGQHANDGADDMMVVCVWPYHTCVLQYFAQLLSFMKLMTAMRGMHHRTPCGVHFPIPGCSCQAR